LVTLLHSGMFFTSRGLHPGQDKTADQPKDAAIRHN
jgi:hypothetical protein